MVTVLFDHTRFASNLNSPFGELGSKDSPSSLISKDNTPIALCSKAGLSRREIMQESTSVENKVRKTKMGATGAGGPEFLEHDKNTQVNFVSSFKSSLPRSLSVCVIALMGSILVLPSSSQILSDGLFADDAFYYFEIASNLVSQQGLSFDSINITNGFQVLWLIMLIPVAFFIEDPDTFIAFVWWIQVLLASFTAGLVFLLVELLGPKARSWIPTAIVAGSLPFLPLWNGGMINGLETPAFTVAVLISLLLLQNFRVKQSTTSAVLLAFSLTLMGFGRLDGILLIALIGLAVWYWGVGSRWSRVLVVVIPITSMGTYFTVNLLMFGSLSPVSGATKTIWGEQALLSAVEAGGTQWQLRLQNLAWIKKYLEPITSNLPQQIADGSLIDLTIVFAVLAFYLFIVWFYWRLNIPILAIFQVFLIGKFFVYGYLQYGHADYIWYWTLDLIGFALFAAVLIQMLFARRRSVSSIAAVGFLILFLLLGVVGNILIDRGRAWLEPDPITMEIAEYSGSKYAAMTINASPITRDLLMTSSDAGILGFFLAGPLVNMDGLVNGRERLTFTQKYGQDQLPYLLAHPEFDGFVNWVRTDSAQAVLDRMGKAGYTEVPTFGKCANSLFGSVKNNRGQLRLYLRPEKAVTWQCPVVK